MQTTSTSLGIDATARIVRSLESRIRDDFQSWSHIYFLLVLISAFVVAIGCFLEGPEIVHELFPSLTQSSISQSPEKCHQFEKAVKKIAAVGWLLICLGVLGEGVFELLQNRAEGQLQTFNDILLTDARLTAAEAENNAASAIRDAGYAASNAANAQASADKANRDAMDAEQKALALTQKTIGLNFLVDEAGWELNPRIVQDTESLKSTLAKYRQYEIHFVSYLNDSEPYFLCLQLAAVAQSASMTVSQGCATLTPTATPLRGIEVSSPDEYLSREIVKELMQVGLKPGLKPGVRPTFGRSFRTGDNRPYIQIFIGTHWGFPTTAPTFTIVKPPKAARKNLKRPSWSTQRSIHALSTRGEFIKRLQFVCLFRANLIVTRFALMAGF